MSQTVDDRDEDCNSDEASTFYVEAHLIFSSASLQFNGQDFKELWACGIAHSTNTYLRAANLAGVPHVKCAGHKVNLTVNAMVRRGANMHETIHSVHRKVKAEKEN